MPPWETLLYMLAFGNRLPLRKPLLNVKDHVFFSHHSFFYTRLNFCGLPLLGSLGKESIAAVILVTTT